MKRHTTRDGWWEFAPTLSDGIDFKTSGALSGYRAADLGDDDWTAANLPLGQLPEEYRASYAAAIYVVESYSTPIAWRLPNRMTGEDDSTQVWVMPNVKYSVTTSRHQNKIRVALNSFAEVREA